MAADADLMHGTLNMLVLEITAETPRYGYEICKLVEQRTKGYFRMREGSLYPALHRMEQAGLLRATWRDAPEGRRRKYYAVTSRGQKELASRKDDWRAFAAAVEAVLGGQRAAGAAVLLG